MRLFIDTLIALMLAALLIGIILYHRQESVDLDNQEQVHRALARLYDQAIYRAAVGETATGIVGFPPSISPLWFGDDLPVNVAAPGRQPWLDVAPPGDMGDHPPDPVVIMSNQAGWWYNPNRGLFRARVAPLLTEKQTLDRYNMMNNAALKLLPKTSDPARRPIPLATAANTLTPVKHSVK